ncbi:MAG: calcium-binding protein [Methylococcales bacterium]|nr:calcium-binding protein [Methylococcales bacterium]
MTIRLHTSLDAKTVTPITNPTWAKSKSSTNSETAPALNAGDELKIDGSAKAATIDYSTSTVDNTIDASASSTVKAITGGHGYDVIIGSATVKSTLTAGSGGSDITAGAGDDKLIGGAGDDNLNGGSGKNTLTGGAGQNTFFSYGTDKITDLTTGDDLYVGSNGIATAIVTGDFVANSATSNDGVAVISDAAGKLVDLSHAGIGRGFKVDAAKASVATLIGGVNADSLIGGGGDDSITAGKGNTLTGGKGADTFTFLAGTTNSVTDLGVGADILKVAATAVVNASAAKGYIAPSTSVINGTANITGVKTLDLSAATGSGSIVLTGSDGKDILKGGGVAIELRGATGDDAYYVNNSVDTVIEATGAGTDSVSSSINYTLTANVENLILTGVATAGTGNELVNKITANDLVNSTLDGGLGADLLIGGLKDDTFVVDNTADVVIDKKGGVDTIQSSVSFTLPANIENLTLTGSGDISGTGNKSDNIITGNSGNNTLTGSKGAAVINGGAGNDLITGGYAVNTLTGGDGADTFVFIKQAGATTITDFDHAQGDHIKINLDAFKGLVASTSTPINSVATGTTAQFIYDSTTGSLSFDADGTNKTAPVVIEIIGNHATLVTGDVIIA